MVSVVSPLKVDLDKCKPCDCGSNLPAQYVCLKRGACEGLKQFCSLEACSNQHDHRLAIIVNVLYGIALKELDFKEKVYILKNNIVDRYDDYQPLEEFLSESQKELRKIKKEYTPDNFVSLGQKSELI